MKEIKDNFSSQAELYACYRPGYPVALYEFLYSIVPGSASAWDCGTGSGQVATVLADHFEKVFATDISEEQVNNAPPRENVYYSIQRSEQTNFPDSFFDLITVAQAVHWFDFNPFYQEVRRIMKPGGILAIMGYGLLKTHDAADEIILHFYQDILGPYWDKERKYIDENYQTIPFPFEEISSPQYTNFFNWTLDDLLGYFRTWSAVKHYIAAHDQDPVEAVKFRLEKIWGSEAQKRIKFPVLLRLACIKK
jgi:SAM-dependent methyltransferase